MKKLNTKLSLSAMGAAVLLLSGCAATQKANEIIERGDKTVVKEYNDSYVKSSAAAISNNDVNKSSNFSKSQKNWVNPNPLPRIEKAPDLPPLFKKNVSMTMPGVIMASEVLSEMQRSVGINFILSPDVYDTSGGMGKLVGGGSSASTSDKVKPLMVSDFVFNGSLEKALDLLAAKINLSWRWNGNAIEIFRYETRTYNIAALAGSTSTNSNVDLKGDTTATVAQGGAGGSGGGSSSGPGSQSKSNVSRTASLTTWDEVKMFLLSQLSPGGTMAVLESAGAVTIKDIPLVHKRVDKSISDLNTLLTKQVYLNVDVYTVSKAEGDDMGLDLSKVNWANSSNFNLGYNSTLGGAVAAGGNNVFNIGILKGPFKGTDIMVRALSTLGETSVTNQFSVTTLNGQPTPIAANRKEAYVAQVTAEKDQDGNVSLSLTPGEISAGVNLNVTPKIEPNGNILLEYAMNLSDIEEIERISSDDGTFIQLPKSTLKSVLQRAVLRSGETLVLSGFKQQNASKNKQGVGSPYNMLLGGSHNAKVGSQYLVITVTPYIANSNQYNR